MQMREQIDLGGTGIGLADINPTINPVDTESMTGSKMPGTTEDTRLRNLASALREQHSMIPTEPKAPSPTDQDILRAMLGKPWKTADSRTVDGQRKAS